MRLTDWRRACEVAAWLTAAVGDAAGAGRAAWRTFARRAIWTESQDPDAETLTSN